MNDLFNRAGVMANAFFGDSIRKRADKQEPYPEHFYHPLWGVPGMVQKPRTITRTNNIPMFPEINPSIVGQTPWMQSIFNSQAYWNKYKARKINAWAYEYPRMQQLTLDSYPYKMGETYTNMGGNTSKHSFQPSRVRGNEPFVYGVPSISSMSNRP